VEGDGVTALDLFRYENHEIHTVLLEGEPWFVAGDIARVLEYRDAYNLVRGLDEDEKGTHIVSTPGGDQSVTVINEAGLYSAIIRSKAERTKPFKRWITHDVLPQIRKTGSYGAPVGMTFEEMTAHVIGELTQRIEDARARAAELEAPAAAWNDLAAADGDLTISEAAKVLSRAGIATGPTKLHNWLEANRWIFRRAGKPLPMQTAVNAGLLTEKVGDYRHPSGERRITTQVRVTPKGLERLQELLTEQTRLAVVE
jgi:prophage antirepressor-like protein